MPTAVLFGEMKCSRRKKGASRKRLKDQHRRQFPSTDIHILALCSKRVSIDADLFTFVPLIFHVEMFTPLKKKNNF